MGEGLFDDAFFLQSTKSGSADVDFEFLAVHNDGLLLNIWLEDFAGLALREGNIVSVHLTFAGDFTNSHYLTSFLAWSTMALKAAGWLTARSARTLRSSWTPCFLRPLMSWE